MIQLIAYLGNEPDNMACALFAARTALYSRGEGRPEGLGLGFVQAGDVLLQKRPRASTAEVDLYGVVKDLRADAFIARVGLGHDDNTSLDDADPFRFRSWLFGSVMDPSVGGFDRARDKMVERIPAFLRRNLRGRSFSEHLFHMFLGFMHEAALLDLSAPDPRAAERVLRRTIATAGEILDASGIKRPRLAALATNGRCLIASRSGYAMQVLEIDGISDCPVCQGREIVRNGRRIPHEGLRAVVVEAHRATHDRPGWRTIPDGASLLVGTDRVLTIVTDGDAGGASPSAR